MPHMPVSACCPLKLYTEYARPRFSLTSWNSREDIPPPNAAFSTPSANRRSSGRASASQPRTRLACSMPREPSVVPTPACGAAPGAWLPFSRGGARPRPAPPRVATAVPLAGEPVDLPAGRVHLGRDLQRGAPLGALEQQVLQVVRRARVRVVLVAGGDADPDAQRPRPHGGQELGNDPQPAGQDGATDMARFGSHLLVVPAGTVPGPAMTVAVAAAAPVAAAAALAPVPVAGAGPAAAVASVTGRPARGQVHARRLAG